MNDFPNRTDRCNRGFTLTDFFSLVTIVIVFLCFANKGATALMGKAETSRLQADIRALNHSIYLFRATGGDLSDALTPEQVITKMQVAETDPVALTASSILVSGFKPVMQSPVEARSDADRAIWNADTQVFELSRDGEPGIKAFHLDP